MQEDATTHTFGKTDERIYLNNNDGELVSIEWNGNDEKKVLHIAGITTYGISVMKHGKVNKDNCMLTEEDAQAQEVNKPANAGQINISPDGTKALAQINNELYVVTIPATGKMVDLSVADASAAAFPAKELTELGGEFPAWESNSKKVHWSLGSSHFVYDLGRAEFFEDSVKQAKKAEEKRIADSIAAVVKAVVKPKDDSVKAKIDTLVKKEVKKKEEPKYKAVETDVKVYYQRDMPKGMMLFKGARIITMKGEEIIDNGDILVENNRIKAIGKSGTLSAPADAKVMDVSGKTIVPGFVDPHSHMWPNWNVHKNQIWIYAANLAWCYDHPRPTNGHHRCAYLWRHGGCR